MLVNQTMYDVCAVLSCCAPFAFRGPSYLGPSWRFDLREFVKEMVHLNWFSNMDSYDLKNPNVEEAGAYIAKLMSMWRLVCWSTGKDSEFGPVRCNFLHSYIVDIIDSSYAVLTKFISCIEEISIVPILKLMPQDLWKFRRISRVMSPSTDLVIPGSDLDFTTWCPVPWNKPREINPWTLFF